MDRRGSLSTLAIAAMATPLGAQTLPRGRVARTAASSSDPVAEGVAASLARPGGNVTGSTYAETDRFKKRLKLQPTR